MGAKQVQIGGKIGASWWQIWARQMQKGAKDCQIRAKYGQKGAKLGAKQGQNERKIGANQIRNECK